jgi:hypothetical protein
MSEEKVKLKKDLFEAATSEKGNKRDLMLEKLEQIVQIVKDEKVADEKKAAEELKNIFKGEETDALQPTLLQCIVDSVTEKVETFKTLINRYTEHCGSNQTIELLKEKDKEGNNVIHYLARYGYAQDADILKFLKEKGLLTAELLHEKNDDHETAFYLAYCRGHYSTYEFLLEEREFKKTNNEKVKITADKNTYGDYIKGYEEFRAINIKGQEESLRGAFNGKNIISGIAQLISAIAGVVAVAEGAGIIYIIMNFLVALAFILGILVLSLIEWDKTRKNYTEASEPFGTYRSTIAEKAKFIFLGLGAIAAVALEVLGLVLPESAIGKLVASSFVAAAPLIAAATIGLITSHLQAKIKYYETESLLRSKKKQEEKITAGIKNRQKEIQKKQLKRQKGNRKILPRPVSAPDSKRISPPLTASSLSPQRSVLAPDSKSINPSLTANPAAKRQQSTTEIKSELKIPTTGSSPPPVLTLETKDISKPPITNTVAADPSTSVGTSISPENLQQSIDAKTIAIAANTMSQIFNNSVSATTSDKAVAAPRTP